jgi:hypothetical protein
VADEPPTNIDAAPNFSASFASFTDDLMFETSESIKTKITGDFLRLDNSNFSTFPTMPYDREGCFNLLF